MIGLRVLNVDDSKDEICKRVENRVESLGLNEWKKGLESERGKEYVSRKMAHEVVKYADGSVELVIYELEV